MTFRKLLTVVLVAVPLLVGGCKSSSGSKSGGSLTDGKAQVPGFFHEIPADTFYAYTGLEPVPEAVVKSRLKEADDSFISKTLKMVQEDSSNSEFGKIVEAVLAELEGNLSPEGMRELGFSMQPHVALYGVGGMPVFRMKLHDPKAFEAMLNRVETKVGADVRMKESDGTKYRLYSEDDVHFPVVVRDGAVVVSAYHKDASDVLLPYVLGQKEPDKSLADTGTIRKLVDSYGYEAHSVGFVDLQEIILTMAGVREPNSATKAVFRAGDFEVENLSDTCENELESLTARAPRMVFGTTHLSTDRTEYAVGLELDDELGSELAGLTNPVPGVESEVFENALLAMGFGVDIQRWTSMMKKHAKSVIESPYECKELEELNKYARQYKDRPVPTVVSQLQGGTFILQDASFSSRSYRPQKLQAMALVRMDNPQTLIGRLQSFVPGMMQADIKNDGVPVPLDQLSRQFSFLQAPHVALKGEVFGFSTGVGVQDSMGAMLEDPTTDATQTAAALSFNLDKMREAIPDSLKSMASGSVGESFWSSTFSGKGQLRLQFREAGIFLVSSGERKSDSGGSSKGNGKSANHSSGEPRSEQARAGTATGAAAE